MIAGVEINREPILIMEPDPDYGELYRVAVEEGTDNFRAVVKQTARDGLIYFEEHRGAPLVVIQRDLPEMKGEIVAERIRSLSGRPDYPHISLVVKDPISTSDLKMMIAIGVNEVINQPIFSPKQIIERLNEVSQRLQNPSM